MSNRSTVDSRIVDPITGYEFKTASETFTEGMKFDNGKPRYDLLAPELLDEVSKVLAFGANKYGDRNWELGMDWHRPFGALMRHMWSWWKGEENDPESGLSHLSHAACNLMFLLAYSKRNVGKDTRSTLGW